MDQRKNLEIARSLIQLKRSEGWQIVLDKLISWEKDAINDFINYQGTDANVMKSKQMALRATREVRFGLVQMIDDAELAAKQILADEALSEEL